MKEATHKLLAECLLVLLPPPDMTLSAWADAFRRLPRGASAEPGRWDTSRAPYQREIMDAISDPAWRKVVIMSAAQIGKTDIILNAIGYHMHLDPDAILVMQPTITMAEAFSKDRLSPMLRDTPVLAERVNEKSRSSGNTIMQKIFPGGHVTMVGANSPAGLRMRPIRILLPDEIDAYPPSAGTEGDPLILAEKRTATFWNKKIVVTSTPTIKGLSRIETEYEHSTQETWHTPCPICGELRSLAWANIKFDKDDLSVIEHKCDMCGALSPEIEWKERAVNGRFIAKYPKRKVRGFFLNSLASNFVPWRDVVEKFLHAVEQKERGNIEPLKAWTNTEMGETWEEQGQTIDHRNLYERREVYGCEVPAGVLYLTCGVDTQDDRLELEIVGWGEGGESWGIYFMALYGNPKHETVWQLLDEVRGQTFIREDGAQMRILSTCVDSGGHCTNAVYAYCAAREHANVWAIRGVPGFDKPFIPKPTRNNREGAALFSLGVDVGKRLIYDRLNISEAKAGYCHFPVDEGRGYDETYFRGLAAERMVMTYRKGRAVYAWVLRDKSYRRNEPLDCRNYAQAAIEIAGVPLKRTADNKKPVKRLGRGQRSAGI